MSTLTVPKGFRYAGGGAGIKPGKRDVALVVSDRAATAAGCFTKNKARAASIDWCAARLPRDDARAIVSNSGNANCMTGAAGVAANARMATALAEALAVPVDAVMTCSTGSIGVLLPVEKIVAAAPALVGALGADPMAAAEAMMTTDLVTKTSSRELAIGGARVRVLGLAKGSGMIHPNMATMLAFLTTDADVAKEPLQALLRAAVEETFNMVSVDRDTSTNDAVMILANGAAENPRITSTEGDAAAKLGAAIFEVCRDLARAIAADGEGATHLLTVRVRGAESRDAARELAKSVVESNLTKAAFFGADPNWGRVAAAIGQRASERGYAFSPERAVIRLQGVAVFARGALQAFDVDALRARLAEKEIAIDVELHEGDHEAVAWGCDLSYDYVRINADYVGAIKAPSPGSAT